MADSDIYILNRRYVTGCIVYIVSITRIQGGIWHNVLPFLLSCRKKGVVPYAKFVRISEYHYSLAQGTPDSIASIHEGLVIPYASMMLLSSLCCFSIAFCSSISRSCSRVRTAD